MKHTRTLAALAVSGLLLTACGGSDDSADTKSSSTTTTTDDGTTTTGASVPESSEVAIEGTVAFGAFDIELTGATIETEEGTERQELVVDAKLTNGSDSPTVPRFGEIVLELPDDESASGSLDAEEVPSGRDGNGQLRFDLPTDDDTPFDASLLDESRIVFGSAEVNQAIVSFADGVEASLEPVAFDPITGLSLDAPPASNGDLVGATLELDQVEMRFTDSEANQGLDAGTALLVMTGTHTSNSDVQFCAGLALEDSSVDLPDGTAAAIEASSDGCNQGDVEPIELSATLTSVETGDYTVTLEVTANGQGDPTTNDPIVLTLAADALDGVLATS